MTELTLSGVVEAYVWAGDKCGTALIDGKDVLAEVRQAFNQYPARKVTVAIADERYDGRLMYDFGSPGYSEYTPAEPAELNVGPHNLIDTLARLDGQRITLWIADEPIDLARREAEAAEAKRQAFEATTQEYLKLVGRKTQWILDLRTELARITGLVDKALREIEELGEVATRRAMQGEDVHPNQSTA